MRPHDDRTPLTAEEQLQQLAAIFARGLLRLLRPGTAATAPPPEPQKPREFLGDSP